MALVACPDCKKKISLDAKNCPSCGAQNKERKLKVKAQAKSNLINLSKILVLTSILISLILLVTTLATRATEKEDLQKDVTNMRINDEFDEKVLTDSQIANLLQIFKDGSLGTNESRSDAVLARRLFNTYVKTTSPQTIKKLEKFMTSDLFMKPPFNAPDEASANVSYIHNLARSFTNASFDADSDGALLQKFQYNNVEYNDALRIIKANKLGFNVDTGPCDIKVYTDPICSPLGYSQKVLLPVILRELK